MARAAGTDVDQPGPRRCSTRRTVLPILIHGDAAFPGQGIVAETLNLSRLAGYDVGGTIHIIANNQLGFTAEPRRVVQHQLRQRPGARLQDSDRRTSTPTTRTPASRRRGWRSPTAQRFQRDFLIDLIGYRRYGHNEGDEPAFTQPLMYQTHRRAPDRARALGAHAGRARRRSPPADADAMVQQHFGELRAAPTPR